jgi:large subunit ribosomal protein L4
MDQELRVLDSIAFEAPKTKEMVAVLNNINTNKALIVLPENDANVIRSANNIPDVATTTVQELNVYDMLKYDYLIMTKAALEKIEEVYA